MGLHIMKCIQFLKQDRLFNLEPWLLSVNSRPDQSKFVKLFELYTFMRILYNVAQ